MDKLAIRYEGEGVGALGLVVDKIVLIIGQ